MALRNETSATGALAKASLVVALLSGAVALAIACSSSSSSDADVGDERAACYPNETCNAGLTCIDGICVRFDAGSDATDGGGSIDAATDGRASTTDGSTEEDAPTVDAVCAPGPKLPVSDGGSACGTVQHFACGAVDDAATVASSGACYFFIGECNRVYCDAGFRNCFTATGCADGSLTGAAIDVRCSYSKECDLP